MASASGAYYVSQTTPYPQNAVTPQLTPCTQLRHEMQREKLQLQELSCEYYELLLETYQRTVSFGARPSQALNRLLDTCQQMLDTEQSPLPAITDANELQFWYQFSTTIEQYCRLQQRLLNYPADISRWQIERPLCQAC